MVTGANEEGTIGAVRALESAGLDADACVVGLGAYMAKDEWNNKGADGTCMKAATYFSSDSVGTGSVTVTSMPAMANSCSLRKATISSSFTIAPLAVLIKMTVGFICSNIWRSKR